MSAYHRVGHTAMEDRFDNVPDPKVKQIRRHIERALLDEPDRWEDTIRLLLGAVPEHVLKLQRTEAEDA